ncbi:TonB-dependent receptor domain-containing protein [Marinoscillum sp. MHG1-6]|uniref:TonB-dependent receptor n=1 Tax=Marinoscillum sp. MHG1-6 TaxID=2959627 RepID=UPI002157C481|nr:TonB-dependent receptor [Marinoscillum sp. MHG1-6]
MRAPLLLRKFLFLLFIATALSVFGQTTISGTITDNDSGEPLIGVNILVKGTVLGTITDYTGKYILEVSSDPPFSLVISSVGYERQEIPVTSKSISGLDVQMKESTLLGQEVVVSASRVEESILKSPVSIEKMDILAVQGTPSDNYYKAIANLKGVDVATSSINFQIINARGFGSTGNTRFVQLIDGMDTQAPALNFPIGSLNGPSELDIESLELLPGASSALYGPNAFNGILLINSKSPFEYQGLSAFAKMGVNHVGKDADHSASPLYEGSIRYAKAFNNKIAFKVNVSYSRAMEDWHGTSTIDRNESFTPEGFDFNPGADRLHFMGDEASLNMNILRFSRTTDPANPGWQTLASSSVGVFEPGLSAWDYAQAGFLPSHLLNSPGYAEKDIVDYGAENLKLNAGLYYRLNDRMELSYLYNGGFGTSVYTGAQRYSLSNFGVEQHRFQLRGDNFFVRAYTTREESGDSYIAEFLGKRINDERFGGDVSNYLTNYPIHYLRSLYDQGYTSSDDPNSVTTAEMITAHQYAEAQMNTLFPFDESGSQFTNAKKKVLKGVVPFGPLFDDASNMYHSEVQYDFKNEIDFMELQAGASFRMFELNSKGTIFPDTTGAITIKEYGAYVQAAKNLTDNFKLSGSVRFDKNENFDGQVNPRISGVYTFNKTHNLRVSFQTGFRNPTTQGQFISLDIITRRLLGGLPQFIDHYGLTKRSSTGVPLAYTGGSVNAFKNYVFDGNSPYDPNAYNLLDPITSFDPVEPEKVKSLEVGYKSLINNRLLIDAVFYYNIYTKFITQVQVSVASELEQADADLINSTYTGGEPALAAGDPSYSSILNPTSDNTYQIYTNLDDLATTQGMAIGLEYNFSGGYNLGGNYSWNKLIGGFTENNLSEFNTPEHKFNVKFGNRKLTDMMGFSIAYRYQSEFEWQSSFAIGQVPAYGALDAQVSLKLEGLKSILKVGGSNILNNYYIQSLGGPDIGAIYYISLTFDEFLN